MDLTLQYVYGAFVVTVFGIPVHIGFGTLILATILWIDAGIYIHRQDDYQPMPKYVFYGMLAMVAAVASMTAHEVAHAVTAYSRGVEIISAGTTPFGMYVERAVPLNQMAPWDSVLISLAGPTINILLALMLYVPVKVMDECMPENALQYVAWLNWRLGKLNFLPVIVLDGGRMFMGVLRMLGMPYSWTVYALYASTVVTLIILGIRRGIRTEENGGESPSIYDPRDRFERNLEEI